jgi:colanic acid/amylovoran biosynthesis protein
LLAGRRPLFYTQSLGPFRKPGMADAVRPYFERSSLILLRDEQSRDHLTRIGIPPEKIHVLADSVFGFADPERLRAAGNAHTVIRRIAISVRQWSFFKGLDAKAGMQAYLAGVADAAAWLIEALDCEIVFISTCQGIPEYWAKDSLVAERAFAMLPQEARERAKVDHDFRSPIELQKILSSFDLVVATRMHMAILALSAGVPVLPIAYEFKTTELFTRLGMGDWVSPIESVATGDFRETLKRFLEFLPAHRKALFEAVELERQAAAKAEALISSTVKIDQAAREKTPRRNVQEKAGLT